MTGGAVTRKRETINVEVEEVEETYWLCANCPGEFEEDEVVMWGPPEGEPVPLCETCSEVMLGYDGPPGGVEQLREATRHWDPKDFALALASVGLALAGLGGAVAVVVAAFGVAFAVAKAPAETLGMTGEAATAAAPVFELVPVLVVFTVLVSIASSIMRMNR